MGGGPDRRKGGLSVAVKDKIFEIVGLWPAATIGIGLGLTFAWVVIMMIWALRKIAF
jgi:hypothetical protein